MNYFENIELMILRKAPRLRIPRGDVVNRIRKAHNRFLLTYLKRINMWNCKYFNFACCLVLFLIFCVVGTMEATI